MSLLQSGLEIDPMQSLLLGTALTRAGATSTKSGTWLREMALRAMPGTTLMSKISFRKHEEALKELGLVDDKHRPTWFTEGKPDIMKMLDIAGARASAIPLERRAGIERQLFGAQGGGGFALLADPAVREQIQNLQKDMNSPEFKNRYAGFTEAYKQCSTVQNARTGMAEFNITMRELGKITLPAANEALRGLKSILEGIRNLLPGTDGKTLALAGGHGALGVLGGAAVGAGVGAFGGSVGVAGGAVIGGALGVAEGFMEGYNKAHAEENKRRWEELREHRPFNMGVRRGDERPAPTNPEGAAKAVLQPLSLNLNLDGRTLASALSTALTTFYQFPGQAAAADGMTQPYSGDHNFPSK